MTSAEFDWKQAAVAVTMSGLEQLQNAGKEQVIDLLGGRIKNAEKTLINNIAADCFSDGTRTAGADRRPPAPRLLDPDHGHGRRHQRRDLVVLAQRVLRRLTDGGAALTSANIQKYMNTVAIKLSAARIAPT
jgi:hypothetical protein